MRMIILTAALSMICTSALAAPLYKWVDDQGVTQFSQQPPASSQYQQVEAAPAPQVGSVAPKASDAQTSNADTSAAAPLATDAAANQAQLEAQCADLREQLQTLENNPRLRRTTADGSIERIDEDERQALIAKAKTDLANHCSD